MTALLDAALAWHDAGFAVIPARPDGSKAPAVNWADLGPPDTGQLRAWFAGTRYDGFGIICGAASGHLEMLEAEGRAARAGQLATLADLLAEHGLADLWRRVSGGYAEATPSGGMHWLYRTEGPAHRNLKLARRRGPGKAVEVLWETRGQGGFVVVAPSAGRTHPTGRPWVTITGSPATVPFITPTERDTLHAIVRLLDEMPDPVPAVGAQRDIVRDGTGAEIVRPGDDYNQRATWEEILTPHGWEKVYRIGDGWAWRRPGKPAHAGISATTGTRDGDNLYVFSTSTVFDAEVPYSKFGAYTLLNHGGDYVAAARELGQRGYGSPLETRERPLFDELTVPAPQEAQEGPQEPPTGTPGGVDPGLAEAVRASLPVIDWHALWADDSEEEWIVEPVIPARRLVALYSPPKVGKSLFMLELAVAVARGTPFLGRPVKARTVLYVDYENDPRGDVRSRLMDMGRTPEELANLRYLSFPSMDALDSARGGQQLLAAAQVYEAELVVIDTVSRAVAGDENENDTWLSLYRHAGMALKSAGIAMVRLDHTGKDETKGMRGGSAKYGDVDAVWSLRLEGEDGLVLECTANRMSLAPEEKRIGLRRLDGPLRHEPTSSAHVIADEELEKCIAALDAAGVPDSFGYRKCSDALAPGRFSQRVFRKAASRRKERGKSVIQL